MGSSNPYRTHSIVGSVGRPVAFHNVMDNNPSFSSASSFEYAPPVAPPITSAVSGVPMSSAIPQQTMMMMPTTQQVQQPMTYMQPGQPMSFMQPQQAGQPMGMMQTQQPVQQQVMYRPLQMQSSMQQMVPTPPPTSTVPQFQSNYLPQNFMYPTHSPGMSFGYRPMMQPGRMIPSGMPMPMMSAGNTLGAPTTSFGSQPPMFNPMAQQLVY